MKSLATKETNDRAEVPELGFQISHDLKDSLRILSLNLDLLMQRLDKGEIERAKSLADAARTTSKKLIKLMNGLIDFGIASQASADEAVLMEEIVKEAVKDLEPLLNQKGVEVSINPLGHAQVDSLFLKEVWKQLIDNAARYGKEKSKIEIGVQITNSQRVYFIQNDGDPIADYLHPQLFKSLVKTTGDVENTGLGLLFCRRVIERHGGKIWLDLSSSSPCFKFTLA